MIILYKAIEGKVWKKFIDFAASEIRQLISAVNLFIVQVPLHSTSFLEYFTYFANLESVKYFIDKFGPQLGS